ncbi:MAG: hypothetical protein KDA93_10180 [Planctomycetaceae bacterium]|nr:hypothetical protein [Planctomycetaceae bacterium]
MADREKSETSLVLPAVLLVVVLYVGFAVAVFVDEQVFGTMFVYSHSPKWLIDALRMAYWPVLKLVGIIP